MQLLRLQHRLGDAWYVQAAPGLAHCARLGVSNSISIINIISSSWRGMAAVGPPVADGCCAAPRCSDVRNCSVSRHGAAPQSPWAPDTDPNALHVNCTAAFATITADAVGLSGNGARYGMSVATFDWASPLFFLALAYVFAPFFSTARVFTTNEWIGRRFNKACRTVSCEPGCCRVCPRVVQWCHVDSLHLFTVADCVMRVCAHVPALCVT